MPKEEIDVLVPETRLEYIKLLYLGMMMAAICVGGNTAISSLWLAIAQSSVDF